MSQFLEKSKKKSPLAALLLLLRRSQGAAPMAAFAVLVTGVFVLPGSVFRGGFRFGPGGPGGPDLQGFRELLSASRGGLPGRGAAGQVPGMRYYGKDTVDYVNGKDVLSQAGGADKAVGSIGKTVNGVLRPEDAGKMAEGVALKEGELEAGLGSGRAPGGVNSMSWGGAGEGRAADRDARLFNSAFDSSQVPDSGGKGGRLNMKSVPAHAQIKNAGEIGKNTSNKSAFQQLARTRAYSIAAAPPPGLCDAGRCPNEYASNTGGLPFDGGKGKGGILTAPEFGDPGAPITPGMEEIGALTDKANRLEKEAKACEAAEAQYGGAERASMEKIGQLSDELNATNCGGGGCSSGNAGKCKSICEEMKRECANYNSIAIQKSNACPLMNGQYSSMDCDADSC